jgi:hypothetical protein
VAERQTVALDVVGSTPTTHPKSLFVLKSLGFTWSVKGPIRPPYPVTFDFKIIWATLLLALCIGSGTPFPYSLRSYECPRDASSPRTRRKLMGDGACDSDTLDQTLRHDLRSRSHCAAQKQSQKPGTHDGLERWPDRPASACVPGRGRLIQSFNNWVAICRKQFLGVTASHC